MVVVLLVVEGQWRQPSGRASAAGHQAWCASGHPVGDAGRMGGERALGVDACKLGWIAVAIDDGVTGAYFAEDIQALIARAEADGPLGVVAIDMPIGLPDSGLRRADVLARAELGPLWPSVFMTPVREALLAADHATASAINRGRAGQGVSMQAYRLRPKLLQVDGWVRDAPVRVVEAIRRSASPGSPEPR
jgi:predicted RNase H-like nuclease